VRKYLFSRSAVPALFAAALTAFLIPGTASADVSTLSSCAAPAVSQPFLGWGDDNWYTPAPGVSPDSFTGAGWVLTGGASVNTTVLADGTIGTVLDLPAGSSATSPAVCVQQDEPYARMLTRTLGTSGSAGAAFFYATPVGSRLAGGMPMVSTTQWAETNFANVFRGIGAEMEYFTFVSDQRAGDLQVYDLFIDPRLRY
jgi:hypothetical protein